MSDLSPTDFGPTPIGDIIPGLLQDAVERSLVSDAPDTCDRCSRSLTNKRQEIPMPANHGSYPRRITVCGSAECVEWADGTRASAWRNELGIGETCSYCGLADDLCICPVLEPNE